MADLTSLAELVDGLLEERAVVHGSAPAAAGDLDVVVRPHAREPLAAALHRAGLVRVGDALVRLADGPVAAVDLGSTAGWGLSDDQAQRLLDDAVPLPGCRSLCLPSPHHELLVLARRLVRTPGPVADRHLDRARRAVEAGGLGAARELAPAWGCRGQLAVLEDVLGSRGPRPVTAREAAAARLADQRRSGRAAPEAALRVARSFLPRRARGAVVALSGLDGAGKSTQAERLVTALEALGHDAVVEWGRVTYDPRLDRVTAPVRKALMAVRRLRGSGSLPRGDAATTAADLPEDRRAARALRDASPVVAATWVTLVTVLHALSVRRSTRRHLRAGRVVVRDRYVLDAVVQLAEQYGDDVDLRLQTRLARALPPRALAAYFLDVPAEVAYGRKPDEHTPEQLARHRQRYLAQTGPLGVRTLDGTRSPDDLARQVLGEVGLLLRP